MRLFDSQKNPTHQAELVCRNSRWGLLLLLAIVWSFPTIWWYFEVPPVAWAFLALAALLTWPLLGTWRRRGSASNWIAAIEPTGLWLNLRDCEYATVAAAETVLLIDYAEIASVSKTVRRYSTPDSDGGDVSHKSTYLDIRLTTDDTEHLRQALAAERRRRAPMRSLLGGIVQVGEGAIRRQPVSLASSKLIRVSWSVHPNYFLTPRIGKVLKLLKTRVEVSPESHGKQGDWQQLDDEQLDEMILDLVASDNRMDAIRILRVRRGCSLAEARQFVEELSVQRS